MSLAVLTSVSITIIHYMLIMRGGRDKTVGAYTTGGRPWGVRQHTLQ